jgi:DNA-binding SARP family transcriptional activator/predicted ATPase
MVNEPSASVINSLQYGYNVSSGTMFKLYVALLGPVAVGLNDQQLDKFRTSRVQALLFYLATERALGAAVHRRETLINLLWPGLPPPSSQANLRQTLYHLRKAIPAIDGPAGGAAIPLLIADRQTVRINPDYAIEIDVAEFTRYLRQPVKLWGPAVDLYRGDFLADFYLADSGAFEEWAATRRAALRRQALTALAKLTSFEMEQGAYEKAERYAHRQLEIDSLQEGAYRQLMKVLDGSGRRSEALVIYEACRSLLQNELGVEPSAETVALFEAIRSGRTEKRRTVTPPEEDDQELRRLADYAPDSWESEISAHLQASSPEDIEQPPAHNLPPQPGPFVGREAELAAMDAFIANANVRLVTIVGPGGIGKTHLALAAAERHLSKALERWQRNHSDTSTSSAIEAPEREIETEPVFEDGVFFASLAELSSVEQIISTVAEALNLKFERGERQTRSPRRQLVDYLGTKRLLLIVDNFEHLLEGADLLTEILQYSTDVQLLVTSRERLHLRREQVYPIHGLEFQQEDAAATQTANHTLDFAAARLFLQSARRIRPDFKPSPVDARHINRICHLVVGMPLALQLAASWVDVLSTQEIAAEIEKNLDFLETSERDIPPRQRSMRALFDTVWERLNQPERDVFAQLSIFRGGFRRPAAHEIAGASIRLLATLTEKSLLQYDEIGGRYQIHKLLRQYGHEKLALNPAELSEVQDRHSATYCAWLQGQKSGLNGSGQLAALFEMEVEGENTRLSWHWAVERRDAARIEQAVDSLCRFYELSGRYQDGEHAAHDAIETLLANQPAAQAPDSPSPGYDQADVSATRLLARTLTWRALFLSKLGRGDETNRLLKEALALLDLPELADLDVRAERAFSLRLLGWLNRNSDSGAAAIMLKESVAMFRELGDRRQLADTLETLGNLARLRNAYGEAEQLLEECLVIRQKLEDARGVANVLLGSGMLAFFQGENRKGEELFQRSYVILQQAGGKINIAEGLAGYSISLVILGEYAGARPLIQKSMDLFESQGAKESLAQLSQLMSMCLLHLGVYEEAYVIGRRSRDLYEEIGPWGYIDLARGRQSYAALAMALYDEAEQLARQALAGSRRIGDLTRVAMNLVCLGYVFRALGDARASNDHILEALQIATDIKNYIALMWVLPAAALLLVDDDEVERAVEIIALVKHYPLLARSRWMDDMAGHAVESAAAVLAPDVVKAAQARGRSLDMWDSAALLLDELT